VNKILGCLLGSAVGDAMGAATEMRNRQQIEEFFGGYVREFYEPPQDTFARGNKAGQVTDDFSLAYDTAWTIVDNNGRIDENIAKEALLRWARPDNYFNRFMGPTTKASIAKLRGVEGVDINVEGFVVCNDNFKATNGSAMKIAPVALFSKGNIDKAINDAIIIAAASHPNNISLSAAAAVAAATSKALNDNVSLMDILEAGLYGARVGDKVGRENYKTLAGPSVEKRMKLAIEIGLTADNLSEAIDKIADIIGSGLLAAEAIPCVFGLIAASKGDALEAIYAGVNVGYDTDTVATMIGGIMGAYKGYEAFDEETLKTIEEVNEYSLVKLSEEIKKIVEND
jgi:ADP-ribosylglycohydrolase